MSTHLENKYENIEQFTHVGEPVRLFCGALRLVGRVAQSKDHRSVVVCRHCSQEVIGECPTDGRSTNGRRWLQFLTDLFKATNVLKVLGVELLLVGDTSALTILHSHTDYRFNGGAVA